MTSHLGLHWYFWEVCCLTAVMDIDTLGTFTMSKAAFPALKAAKSSCIINISMTLHYGATWYQTHASAAKVSNAKSDLHMKRPHKWHCLIEHQQHSPLSIYTELLSRPATVKHLGPNQAGWNPIPTNLCLTSISLTCQHTCLLMSSLRCAAQTSVSEVSI